VEYTGADPVGFVVPVNIKRRHASGILVSASAWQSPKSSRAIAATLTPSRRPDGLDPSANSRS
jgi:hypothetical protein